MVLDHSLEALTLPMQHRLYNCLYRINGSACAAAGVNGSACTADNDTGSVHMNTLARLVMALLMLMVTRSLLTDSRQSLASKILVD